MLSVFSWRDPISQYFQTRGSPDELLRLLGDFERNALFCSHQQSGTALCRPLGSAGPSLTFLLRRSWDRNSTKLYLVALIKSRTLGGPIKRGGPDLSTPDAHSLSAFSYSSSLSLVSRLAYITPIKAPPKWQAHHPRLRFLNQLVSPTHTRSRKLYILFF